MINIIRKKLLLKITLAFMTAALIAVAAVGYLSYESSYRTLKEEVSDKLQAVLEIKKNQVKEFFRESLADVKVLSRMPFVRDAITALARLSAEAAARGNNGDRLLDDEPFRQVFDKYYGLLKTYKNIYNYYDLFLFAPGSGRVVLTVNLENDFGTELARESHHLARAWEKMKQDKTALVTDIDRYSPSKDAPAMFILAPVRDGGKIAGAVGVQVSQEEINSIMLERTGLGETGETILVGDDLLMRSDSRFKKESTVLDLKVDTIPTRSARDNKSGVEIIIDYRNTKVLAAYASVDLDHGEVIGAGFDWSIIAKVDLEELMQPAAALRRRIIFIGVMTFLVVFILSFFISKGIAAPVKEVSRFVLKAAAGDLETGFSVRKKRSDEIGDLAGAVEKMSTNLRQQILHIREGVNIIAGSGSEISAAARQFASSSSEIAASVNETAASMKQLKQTAVLTNEKAGYMAESSRSVSTTAGAGKKAVDVTVTAMNDIREQMISIADSIVELSEQSRSIGEIIAVVDDIAEQSRLLAVNAAIEAVKAGEYGQGFSVVAAEIKSLADQSRTSTAQVRRIIGDIQQATGQAVLVTEKGNKAVEKGMKQAELSGQSIDTLASSIEETTGVAVQIEATSRQQLAGIEQVVAAVENIDSAITHNAGGAEQLKNSTLDLEELGKRLQKLVEDYNVGGRPVPG